MKNNRTVYRISLLLALVSAFFITCKKEYSYEGGGQSGNAAGTALYSFISTGTECSGAVVNGLYYKGTALNAANNVQLQVNVTQPGTYTVSTGTVSGTRFTASGQFTTTGIQSILLSGEGTPSGSGTFRYSTPLAPACSFTVQVADPQTIPSDFTLAGAPADCLNAVVNGSYIEGTALSNINTVTISVHVNSIGTYTLKTDTLNGISFSKSGVFTSTGDQQVTLQGSGTPGTPHMLNFRLKGGLSSCGIPVAVYPPAPNATYVLESGFGSPSPCIYTISGNYVAGTTLNASNTVTIRVYVSMTGNFCIDTGIINGMEFYYNGQFSNTGVQYVVLQGSGTPAVTGFSSFIPQIIGPHPLGGQSCGFTVNVN